MPDGGVPDGGVADVDPPSEPVGDGEPAEPSPGDAPDAGAPTPAVPPEAGPTEPSTEPGEPAGETPKRRRRGRPPMAFVPQRKMLDGWRPRQKLPPKMRVRMHQVAQQVGLRPHEFRMAGALLGLAVAMMVTGAVGLLLVRFLLM